MSRRLSRRSRSIVAAALGLSVSGSVALAQNAPAPAPAAPAPATAPAAATTQGADIPTDQSTPKSALRVLADGMEAGDKDKILGVLLAGSPQEQKMANAMAELAGAIAGLRKDAVAAFGAEGAKLLTGDTAATVAQGLARLGAATEKIEGDKATVTVGTGDATEPPVTLVKQDGKWKYPVAEMAKGIDAAQIEKGIEDAAAQTKLLKDAAEEVRGGKYKTGEEVRQTLEQRVMQMVLARQKAATQPATQGAPAGPQPAPAPAPGAPKPAP
jgi:pyruvate dehydrogenase E2 component (dihydrolipoamide acetyltransferase)